MRANADRQALDRRINRRALMLFGVQGTVVAALAARLYQLQIVEGEGYAALAERNRVRPRLLAPVRGQIVDRSGKPLALNQPNYQLHFYRERGGEVDQLLRNLQSLMHLSDERVETLRAKIFDTRAFLPVTLAQNLDWDEFSLLAANAAALPGTEPIVGLSRSYPAAETAGHVIGYVSAVSERDLDRAGRARGLLSLPEMRIGKTGIERSEESVLRGSAGLLKLEKDVHGRPVRELERRDGSPGEDLQLTIDADLQRYAMQRMGEESGAVVVMDVFNGDVLAMASAPGFDPNAFVLGLSESDWSALRDDPRKPLSDKSVAGLYPPGSTFKILVAAAALEAGIVSPSQTVYCRGHVELGNRRFHCWKRGGHGPMNLHDAIKKSCDVYFYDLARKLGIDRLAEAARDFGIGIVPEVGLDHARAGVMPDTAWKRAQLNDSWHTGETLIAGIGQGFILTSPLQLAVMTSKIANGGYGIKPRLIRARNGERIRAPALVDTGFGEANVARIQSAMDAVVNEPGGTAFASRIVSERHRMAGKTGTSQVRRISREERETTGVLKNEELPWEMRDHALFVAFAPVGAPRYVISVIVEHGGGGSKAAAPIARDVLLRLQLGEDIPEDAIPKGARPFFKPPKPEDKDSKTSETPDERPQG